VTATAPADVVRRAARASLRRLAERLAPSPGAALDDGGRRQLEGLRELIAHQRAGLPVPAEFEALAVDAFRSLYERDLDRLPSPVVREAIADQFSRLYYHDRRTWRQTYWFGTPTWKCPLDLWLYQELLHEVEPDLIVETGTAFGGSANYLAWLCDRVDRGRIVSVDIEARPGRPEHPRVTYLQGSSTDPAVVDRVRALIPAGARVLVILDSDHSEAHVLAELRAYADLVTPRSYVIVEDSNVNGHPVLPDFGPGPMEALEQFLRERPDFLVDETREKFYLTFNPRGYLRRLW